MYRNETKTFIISTTKYSECIAYGEYNDLIDETGNLEVNSGWSFLQISTNNSYLDEMQAFAAGYLEAYLTQRRIYLHWLNGMENTTEYSKISFYTNFINLIKNVKSFIDKNEKWYTEEVRKDLSKPFNYQANLLFQQAEGIRHGYIELSPSDQVKAAEI